VQINFEKWQGCRNDFILIWLGQNQEIIFDSILRNTASLCSKLGDGIGADGIIILHYSKEEQKPESITIINSDGSIAQTCGNGIRCAALAILKKQCEFQQYSHELPEGISFKVAEKLTTCRYLGPSKIANFDNPPLVAVDMGTASINSQVPWYEDAKAQVDKCLNDLNYSNKLIDFGVCELANNHLVLFFEEVSAKMIREIGPTLQKSELWDGINVHIAASIELTNEHQKDIQQKLRSPISELYEVFVWERGAGETQACGSGACAVAACVLDDGMTERNEWLAVKMPGGYVYVKQVESDDPITLVGPAAHVFSGVVDV